MFYSSTYVSLLFCWHAAVHFESETQVINSRKTRRPFCLMADDVREQRALITGVSLHRTCRVVGGCVGACCRLLVTRPCWWCRCHFPPKRRYISTRLDGVTFQQIEIVLVIVGNTSVSDRGSSRERESLVTATPTVKWSATGFGLQKDSSRTKFGNKQEKNTGYCVHYSWGHNCTDSPNIHSLHTLQLVSQLYRQPNCRLTAYTTAGVATVQTAQL